VTLEELAKDGIVAVGLVIEDLLDDLAEGRDPLERPK
jgi:hypothetical protein